MIFCFVVLHYKTVDDTFACIESILSLNDDRQHEVHIVVVANASNNGSIELIEWKYQNDKKIHILKNGENLGFAKGNNVGYTYAKERLRADYISIINNDIVIKSKDYIAQICRASSNYGFHVLGPDIVSMVDCGHQNPMQFLNTSTHSVKKRIWRYKILLFLSKVKVYDFLKLFMGKKATEETGTSYERDICSNCQLHGSFLVFSPRYINNEVYAFYPETFLYCEEAILCHHCMSKDYKTLYYPDIVVEHKEDSATSFVCNTKKSKREFIFKHYINSHQIFLKLLLGKEKWE